MKEDQNNLMIGKSRVIFKLPSTEYKLHISKFEGKEKTT